MRSPSTTMLALDTSTRTVGLALYDGMQVLNESVWTSQDYHTVELAPAVVQAFEKAGLKGEDLGALAVALGPGSFTGLRVGLALAKGLALVHHIPIIGVPTLDVLAEAQPFMDISMAVVLRAGRGRLAVGWYLVTNRRWKSIKEIEVLTPQDLVERIENPTLVCGELTQEERTLFAHKHPNILLATPARSLRRPSFLAELAWKRWQSGEMDDPTTLAPIYLHYNVPIPG